MTEATPQLSQPELEGEIYYLNVRKISVRSK